MLSTVKHEESPHLEVADNHHIVHVSKTTFQNKMLSQEEQVEAVLPDRYSCAANHQVHDPFVAEQSRVAEITSPCVLQTTIQDGDSGQVISAVNCYFMCQVSIASMETVAPNLKLLQRAAMICPGHRHCGYIGIHRHCVCHAQLILKFMATYRMVPCSRVRFPTVHTYIYRSR